MLGMDSPGHRAGGLNRYFDELFSALQEAGTDLHAIRVGSRNVSTVALTEVSSPLGTPGRIVRYLCATVRQAKRAAVVDVHFALYAALPLFLRIFRGKRVVVHFHGPWYKESAQAGSRSRLRIAAQRRIERYVYGRADLVVVLSRAFGDVLRREFAVPGEKIRLIRPGVAESFFDAPPVPAGVCIPQWAGSRFAVCVRRLTPRMGIDVLLRAWTRLALSESASLVIVGEGHQRQELEAITQRLGLVDRVTFTGRVEDSALSSIYAAASLAIVPSVALEGFGLVVLEALAAGTPVIATDIGGLPEVLRPLRDDLVVPADDERALATRVMAALRGDVPSAEECKRYAQNFRWSAVASEHGGVYWP